MGQRGVPGNYLCIFNTELGFAFYDFSINRK